MFPGREDLCEDFVITESNKLTRGVCISEFPSEHFGIVLPHPERYHRTDIAEDRFPEGRLELVDVLMRESKT